MLCILTFELFSFPQLGAPPVMGKGVYTLICPFPSPPLPTFKQNNTTDVLLADGNIVKG